MQVPGLGHAVGRVGEGGRRGSRAELAQPELAGQQVAADEGQRPGEEEQQVVADERGDGARAEEGGGAVAEQRVGEGEAQRVGIEGVCVEQVQRLVQHGVADPGDLPGGAHGVAEVRRDAAGQMQHERPRDEHGERDAGEDRPEDLAACELRRGRPACGVRRRRATALDVTVALFGRGDAAWAHGLISRRVRGGGDPGAHRLLVFATRGIGAAYGSGERRNAGRRSRDRSLRRSGARAQGRCARRTSRYASDCAR